jgi:hydroxymethylbilane synthase
MNREFVLGSRGSALAMGQTEDVVSRLRSAHPDLIVRVEIVRTTADTDPERPFEQLPGAGFFVKELETALLERRIDAAVHSMKDLPIELCGDLRIAAMPPREDPRDVLVARHGATLESLPSGARIGTSSPRRAAYLRAARPDLIAVPVRGNVDTRIRNVDEGVLDAVCLAAAGLTRLGLDHRVSQWLPIDQMLPAPGQGALGVEVRADDGDAVTALATLDDAPTRQAVLAERAVLRRVQGGCRVPVGALATIGGAGLDLRAAVIAPDGSRLIAGTRSGSAAAAEALGTDLAEELLARGAAALLPAGTEVRR